MTMSDQDLPHLSDDSDQLLDSLLADSYQRAQAALSEGLDLEESLSLITGQEVAVPETVQQAAQLSIQYRSGHQARSLSGSAETGQTRSLSTLEGTLSKVRPAREADVYALSDGRDLVGVDNVSSFVSPDGPLCGLFAVDIVGFNSHSRDDGIQAYVRESLYKMLQTAFDRSDVPWFGCAHEDRGDGVLVIVPPLIPVAGLVDDIPDRLRGLVRRHNRISAEAARIQLRVAMHIGPVHNDGHGFVGHDVNLLCRLLDARSLKRMLTQSGAEVAFITSGYVYENIIRRRPSLVDPALFQPLSVRVKETRTRGWAHILGT
jgi:hypothetical protein